MRSRARLGGQKSGEARRKKRAAKGLIGQYADERGIDLDPALLDVRSVKRPNLSGGSHDTDWRCPFCRHYNSIKRRSCAKCFLTPANGRWTRARLRERAAERRTQSMLRRRGL